MAFADGCRRGASPRLYWHGLGKASTEDAVLVRHPDPGQVRPGPVRVWPTDWYDMRFGTRSDHGPVRHSNQYSCVCRTSTISDWHELGTARMGRPY